MWMMLLINLIKNDVVQHTHLTMTSKDGVSKERIDYEKPFANCSN